MVRSSDNSATVKIGRFLLTRLLDEAKVEFSIDELIEAAELKEGKRARKIISEIYRGMYSSERGIFSPNVDSFGGRIEFREHLGAIVHALENPTNGEGWRKGPRGIESYAQRASFGKSRGRRF